MTPSKPAPELAHEAVTAQGAAPARWAAFLHGVFGRGSNWQGFARKLVAAQPAWGARLLDLRMHGDSQAFRPPHTLARAARDVRDTLVAAPSASAVIGHSLGGKIALLLAADPPPGLEQIWVLDASPSVREPGAGDSTRGVLGALADMPPRVASRNQFAAELARRGVHPGLGPWLAKNLVHEPDGLRFALDLAAIRELIDDFDRTDLWPLIEAPPPGLALRVVVAGQSTAVSPSDRARLQAAAARGAIELFELPGAGHWLHVDDPEGLLRVMLPYF